MLQFSPLFVIYATNLLSMKHLLLTVLSLTVFTICASAQLTEQQQIQKLNLAYQQIRNLYVDDIVLEPLVDEAIRATLKQLDPHSAYLSKEDMAKRKSRLSGKFAGVGISYIMHNDTLVVKSTMSNSPASRAGIMPFDRITDVDNRSIIGIEADSVSTLLRGEANSSLSLKVVRRGAHNTLTIKLKRDYIDSNAVSASYRIGDVGYIAISSFSKPLANEVYEAYKALGDIESLIIDLRDNGGGALTAAIDLSSMFLNKGDIIASTEGKTRNEVYYKKQERINLSIPLVVVINENSASASELFSGAIQDHDRGVIVGRTSYGKGLVQRVIDLKDGSGMSITIARYKTPSGRIIQRPYEMGEGDKYRSDTLRYMHPDSIPHDSKFLFYTLKNHRKVYGGGGITPDIYIAPDSINLSSSIIKAHNAAAFEHAIIDYFDTEDIDVIKIQYPTIEEFSCDYAPDSKLLNIFNDYIEQAELTDTDRAFIGSMLKAFVASELYGSFAYYYIYGIDLDHTLNQAIAIASNEELMQRTLTSH